MKIPQEEVDQIDKKNQLCRRQSKYHRIFRDWSVTEPKVLNHIPSISFDPIPNNLLKVKILNCKY